MTTVESLCLPDNKKSCFACCPPIRPAGYEHIQHKNIIRRMLRENRERIDRDRRGAHPITGFSCWAMGYLDGNYRLVGCMLHPARNQGKDLRDRTGYGEKCRRETCPEAKIFSGLGIQERKFWLRLTDTMDSFSYSSRDVNPLFNLMGWGTGLLQMIARRESPVPMTRETFFQDYPFFSSALFPKANGYLLTRLMTADNIHILGHAFRAAFERFSMDLSERVKERSFDAPDAPPVHQLDLDPQFLDFLRLSAHVRRMEPGDARRLKDFVDTELDVLKRCL